MKTKIRTVVIDGEVWFVAKDICDILEIVNSRDATSSLSDKMKLILQGKESLVGLTDDPNIIQISLISEPGMYKLVFKSRKPEAEKFSDWVVSEVLPLDINLYRNLCFNSRNTFPKHTL